MRTVFSSDRVHKTKIFIWCKYAILIQAYNSRRSLAFSWVIILNLLLLFHCRFYFFILAFYVLYFSFLLYFCLFIFLNIFFIILVKFYISFLFLIEFILFFVITVLISSYFIFFFSMFLFFYFFFFSFFVFCFYFYFLFMVTPFSTCGSLGFMNSALSVRPAVCPPACNAIFSGLAHFFLLIFCVRLVILYWLFFWNYTCWQALMTS